MKIGIDTRFYSPEHTGIGRYVYELIENIIELDKENEYVLFFNEKGYDSFKIPNKRFKKVLVNAPHYSLREQTVFLYKILQEKLDLMHFTHFNVPLLYRRPFLVTIHDMTLSFFPGKKKNHWFGRKAYEITLKHAAKKSLGIISVSKNTKKDLVENLSVAEEKIEVIYLGVSKNFTPKTNSEKNTELRKKYGITRDFVLYTGLWRSHKNLVNLIKAIPYVKEDIPDKVQLVITGKEDPHYPEIKRTVKDFDLDQDIVFTGYVDDNELLSLYQEATLFAFPSLYEGFGLPPIEAMRCGTPVIASNCGSIPEVCGEQAALYFDPYDPSNIAQTIRKVWLDEALQKELREAGLEHSRKFKWENMATKTIKMYSKFSQ